MTVLVTITNHLATETPVLIADVQTPRYSDEPSPEKMEVSPLDEWYEAADTPGDVVRATKEAMSPSAEPIVTPLAGMFGFSGPYPRAPGESVFGPRHKPDPPVEPAGTRTITHTETRQRQ